MSMKTTFIITAVVLLLSRGGLTKHSDFIQESNDREVRSHTRLHDGHGQGDSSHHSGISENLILVIVLPTVLVVAMIVIIAIIICIVYRTHFSYGNVCCFKPKRRPVNLQGHDDYQLEESGSPSPPVYSGMSSAAPPVYSDAITDVILQKGVDPSTVSLPPYVPPQQPTDQSITAVDSQCNTHESQTQSSQVRQCHDDEAAKNSLEESSSEVEIDSTPEQNSLVHNIF